MSLYAAYALNEGSGSTIIDYSGNGRNMTTAGSNSWVAGKYYANAFAAGASGSDGAQWDAGSAQAALSGDVTVMLWYQHTAATTTTLSHGGGLYSAAGTSRLSVYSYRNRSSIASSPHMTIRDSAAVIIDAGVNGTVADSSWHHAAFVYHASGAMDEYLDGVLLSPTITPTTVNPIGVNVRLIGVGSILSGAAAQANVQDMRVFDSALTSSDITTYMNTPVTTIYRLFPATNGPSAATSYTGNFISGVLFAVAGGGHWFEGYWWWVCSTGQATGPVKCALWAVEQGSSPTGVLVSGSVVTSGTLTAGQWNWIPLANPIQLAPGWDSSHSVNGSAYIAAVGCNGAFPDTSGYWSVPVSNGPLHAYSGNQAGDPNPPPYSLSQGVFSTAGSDPSTAMPGSASGIDNFWVDVQTSDTAPAGYSGSYRLWPNKADSNVVTIGDAAFNYTVGTECHLTQACTLNNVWYFSPAAATTLATRCDVWNISTGLSVASITSPSWTDAAGTAYTPPGTVSPPAGAGTWIKAAFAGGVTLPAGSYRVTIYNSNGTSDANWSAKDAGTDYWGETFSGVGVSGITWGPLYAPGWANASAGYLYGGSSANTPPYSNGTVAHAQPPFGQLPSGLVDFPQLYAPTGAGTNQSQNYWVDLEVTPNSSSGVTGSTAAVAVAAPFGSASVSVTESPAGVAVAAPAGIPSVLVAGSTAGVSAAAPYGQPGTAMAGLVAQMLAAGHYGNANISVSQNPVNVAVAALLGSAAAANPATVNGMVAAVMVQAWLGIPSGFSPGEQQVVASVMSSFRARKTVSAQATMEFEAGQPVQTSLTTLASDPWISMYPG